MQYFTVGYLNRLSAGAVAPAEPVEGQEGGHIYLMFRHSKPEVLTEVIRHLQAQGFSLYIDQLSMRYCNDELPAAALKAVRAQLETARCLLVVADNIAALSNTDSWLLGLFEGMKPGRVAGWPILQYTTAEWRPPESLLRSCPLIVQALAEGDAPEQPNLITLNDFMKTL